MKASMARRARIGLIALALGGMPLITTATCDPRYGAFDFYRDDDSDYYYDDVYYDGVVIYEDPYYYDDCWLFDCW